MIFASDLDRTMIYSDKFLEEFPGEVVAVERGKYFSYMTKRAVVLLKVLAERITFIPCTTRTIEQYQRIQFFHDQVVPSYAIVSNGANILLNGLLDIGYQDNIRQALLNDCLAGEDILKEFEKIAHQDWAQALRNADGVFYYCIVDREKLPWKELESFAKWALRQKWEISVQGRKLYLVPQVVNKWSALKRIMEVKEDGRILSAGDSLLDLPLIKGAEYSISPAHGELYEQYGQASKLAKWQFTKSPGIKAGEEILGAISKLVDNLDNQRR